MNSLWQRVQSSFERQQFLTLIGARIETVIDGKVSISCSRKPELTQQQGFLHGGVVASIADVACGYAALTKIPEGQEVLTAEFKINLIRPITGEKIIANGTVIKSGKTLLITEADVIDMDSGKLVAKVLATMVPATIHIQSKNEQE